MAYVIRFLTPLKLGLVAGFNSQHQIVQSTPEAGRARRFATKQSALSFCHKYADVGYGMSMSDVVIEEVGTRCDWCVENGVENCRHEGM